VRRWLPLLAAAAVISLLVGFFVVRPQGGGRVELDGAWFVLYEDDARPYLDVAFRGKREALVSVRATLVGGSESYEFDLVDNPADGEWQCDCTSLPDLTPGIWWVSRVDATLRDGRTVQWSSPSPFAPYEGTDIPTGFFFVPAPEGPRTRIETVAVEGGTTADTALFVFPEDDLTQWIAAADDPTTTSALAVLDAPLPPGRWIVRIDGGDDAGAYVVRLGGGGEAVDGGPEVEPDGPGNPTPLLEGRTYRRSVGGDDESDWFLLEVPAP
jgi:hypothetical protein